MTQTEVGSLLAMNKATFPYAYKDMAKDEKAVLLDVWFAQFGKFSAELVKNAFGLALRECSVPVTPADVWKQINKVLRAAQKSEEELWIEFTKAAREANELQCMFKYTYSLPGGELSQGEVARIDAQKLYDGLPSEIKSFCGNFSQLAQYWDLPDSELIQFVKPQFMKRIPILREVAEIRSECPTLVGRKMQELLTDSIKTLEQQNGK